MKYKLEVVCDYPDLGAIEMVLYMQHKKKSVWSMVVCFHEADALRDQVKRLADARMLHYPGAVYMAINSSVQACEAFEAEQVRRKGRTILDSIIDIALGRRPTDE